MSAVVLPGRTVFVYVAYFLLCSVSHQSPGTDSQVNGVTATPVITVKELTGMAAGAIPTSQVFFFINRTQTLPDAVGMFSFTSSLFDSLNPTYITFSLCRLGHVTSEIFVLKD